MEEKKAVSSRIGLKEVLIVILLLIIGSTLILGSKWGEVRYQEGYTDGYKVGLQDGHEIWQFAFYYVKPSERKYGVNDLAKELEGLEWIQPYQEGVFDCSEMSAYLERYLENKGWHTIIVVGNSPFGSGRHAWLLVETSQDHYMPVEPTNVQVVWWEDPNFDNYFKYDHEFEKIQDALKYDPTEFDWWKK